MKCILLLILIFQLCAGLKDTSSINKKTRSKLDEHSTVIYMKPEWASQYNITDNGLEKTMTVCVLNVTSTDIQLCNETVVKVIIGNMGKDQTIPNHEQSDHKHIVVCLKNKIKPEHESIKNHYHYFDIDLQLCNKGLNIKPDTLAVLAPVPLENTESDIPFVFYETTYLTTDYKDRFPNSTTLVHWQSEVTAIKEFLKLMKWTRVAIFSDESEFSEIFEKELISKLSKDILYEGKQCTGRYCDFKKALTEFRDLDVKVIIANIDESNTKKLLNTARNIKMGRDVHWIFRGHLSMDIEQTVGYIYNIHLQPNSRYTHFTNVAYLTNIYVGISKIVNIYNKIFGNNKDYVRFVRALTSEAVESNVIAEVYSHTRSQKLATLRIYKDIVKHSILHIQEYYSDLPSGCTVKGDTFHKPCNDMYVLYIIVVVIMSLLFALLILWFFDRLHSNTINYEYIDADVMHTAF